MANFSVNRPLMLMTGSAICAVIAIAAQAQTSSSPFAKKNKKQAWETTNEVPASKPVNNLRRSQGHYIPPSQSRLDAPPAAPPSSASPQARSQASSQTMPAPSSARPLPQNLAPATAGGQYVSKSYGAPKAQGTQPLPRPQNYPPQNTYAPQANQARAAQYQNLASKTYKPLPHSSAPSASGAYYPGRAQPTYGAQAQQNRTQQSRAQQYGTQQMPRQSAQPFPQNPQYGPQYGQAQTTPQSYPGSSGPMRAKPAKRSWADKLGLKNIATSLKGFLKLGAGATERGDWGEDFIVDGSVRGEVSAITSGGLEYGAGLELRGQYDKYRRGFGGRVGDCPPNLAGCASVLVGGIPASVRGHTSRFYTGGPSDAEEFEASLEGAYFFLRSAYGDLTVGRDDGAAYLFSLGAPTLLSVGASNNSVDYTGLDAVKTINDASGFAEKLTYVSPRLLGDTVGIGIQLGASYAPDARACGVDYCVQANGKGPSGALAPDLKDVFEAGLSLDRKFNNGLSVEATATYAIASEDSTLVVFDDLQALGLGLELGYGDFALGGSYLNSNNALVDGDYTAWDIGATYKPSKLGFTLGYGQAEDKNINLKSDQAVFGVSYDWNDHFRFGSGVQYIRRDVPVDMGGIVSQSKEEATSVFVEGRVTF